MPTDPESGVASSKLPPLRGASRTQTETLKFVYDSMYESLLPPLHPDRQKFVTFVVGLFVLCVCVCVCLVFPWFSLAVVACGFCNLLVSFGANMRAGIGIEVYRNERAYLLLLMIHTFLWPRLWSADRYGVFVLFSVSSFLSAYSVAAPNT